MVISRYKTETKIQWLSINEWAKSGYNLLLGEYYNTISKKLWTVTLNKEQPTNFPQFSESMSKWS